MSDASPVVSSARCPGCDYLLTGLTVNRCPECGRAFDPSELAGTRVPWEQRRSLGLIKAYLRTVGMATFRPKQLAAERDASLRYASARAFGHITTVLASLPLLGAFAAFVIADPIGWIAAARVTDWIVICSIPVCSVLAVAACIGLPSYFFHPKAIPVATQNRAIALSYYAAGPLAWVPLLAAGPLLAAFPSTSGDPIFSGLTLGGQVAIVILGLCNPIPVLLWWSLLARLASATSGSSGRSVLVLLVVPILWVVVGVGIAVALPLSFAFLGIVYESLT